MHEREPSGATRLVQPLQLQEVDPSAYCRVWYSWLGFESEAKLQTRVICLVMRMRTTLLLASWLAVADSECGQMFRSGYKSRGCSLPVGKDLMDVIALQKSLGVAAPETLLAPGQPKDLLVAESILVRDLAALLGQDLPRILADLIQIGVFAQADDHIDFEAVSKVAKKYGLEARRPPRKGQGPAGISLQ